MKMTREQFLELFKAEDCDDFICNIIEKNYKAGIEEEDIDWFKEAQDQIETMNNLILNSF